MKKEIYKKYYTSEIHLKVLKKLTEQIVGLQNRPINIGTTRITLFLDSQGMQYKYFIHDHYAARTVQFLENNKVNHQKLWRLILFSL